MARLRWTTQAADDIEAICEFVSRDSIYYAKIFARDVIDAVANLETFPLSGRVIPEFGDEALRELILGNYRVLYRTHPDLVEILAVYHSARLLIFENLK
jgi:plasmid stabilization system protein ParE